MPHPLADILTHHPALTTVGFESGADPAEEEAIGLRRRELRAGEASFAAVGAWIRKHLRLLPALDAPGGDAGPAASPLTSRCCSKRRKHVGRAGSLSHTGLDRGMRQWMQHLSCRFNHKGQENLPTN
jgi:hypothetical protein